jgi:hypothetical protein
MHKHKWTKSLLLIFGCAALLTAPLVETGCKQTLAPGGAYSQVDSNGVAQPQAGLYTADLGINSAKDIIHGFLRWELSNRPLVQKQWPDVTTYAIKLSNDAPKWLQSAVSLRDAYKANPTAENKSAFDAVMAVLEQAVTEAQKYWAQGVKSR